MFANGLGDLGSIPGRVIPKAQKMVLDACLLNTQHYKVRIKGKVEQSREGVAPSPTTWCSSYRKGSLRVTLDYGRQLYLLTFIWAAFKSPSEWIMNNLSAYPLPRYFQSQRVSAMAWTALFTWYTCCKRVCTKILQNLWLFLVSKNEEIAASFPNVSANQEFRTYYFQLL